MKKEKISNMKRDSKGITLIALVITIIVLLILAGVTIATLTGDNGILTRATDASEQTKLADEKEKIELSAVGALAKENGEEISQTTLEEELGKYFKNGKYAVEPGTNEDGTEGYIITITENDPNGRTYFVDKNGNMKDYIEREPEETPDDATVTELSEMRYGVIEVEFLSGTSYNTTATPNHPVLKDGMTAIIYNETDGTTQDVSDDSRTDWYSYIETTDSDMSDGGTTDGGNSHWANAKVTVNNVDSYFVWIPRYAYRIIYFDTEEHENAYRAGSLTEKDALANNQIVGYSDARGIVTAEGKKPTDVASQTAISVNDKYFKTHPVFDGDVNYGGWAEDDGTPVKLEGIWVAKYEASQVSGTTTPKFEPEVLGWTDQTIGDMYTYAREYNANLNSHMMKNSEWGVVAYLTESKYGRNGTEITPNMTVYTGGMKEFEKNTKQSSTGNVYGIYDLSGGNKEYVAGFDNKNKSFPNYGESFAGKDKESDAYSTAYEGENEYKYGDATYETKQWNNCYTSENSMDRFCSRGGACNHSYNNLYKDKELFMYSDEHGRDGCTFRVCLAIQ